MVARRQLNKQTKYVSCSTKQIIICKHRTEQKPLKKIVKTKMQEYSVRGNKKTKAYVIDFKNNAACMYKVFECHEQNNNNKKFKKQRYILLLVRGMVAYNVYSIGSRYSIVSSA